MSELRYPKEGAAQLVFFRHLRSEYTAGREHLHADSLYEEFSWRYRRQFYEQFPSARLQHLAKLLQASHPRVFPDPYPLLANPNDAKILGCSLRDLVRRGEILRPDVVVVAPAMRTWLTFAGVRSEFPELMEAMDRQRAVLDMGPLSQHKLKSILASDSLMTEDWRVAGKDYGDISQYSEENVYFALNWDQQRLLAKWGDAGEFWYRPPRGENIPDVLQRLRSWRNYVSRKHSGKVIWVFGQLDTILAFTVLAKRLPPDKTEQEFLRLRRDSKPVHGGMTYFGSEPHPQHGYRYVLQKYNQDILGAGKALIRM